MATLVARPVKRSTDDAFFVTMSLVMLAAVLFGFAHSYFLRGAVFAKLPSPLVHLHGAAFSLWIVLFIVQTVLVAKRNIQLHRTLGTAGGFLAGAMILLGWTATIALVRRGATPAVFTPPMFLILNNLEVTVFGILVAWAIVLRNKAPQHKRLMLLATLNLMPPAISRWPLSLLVEKPYFVGIFLFTFVLSVLAYDLFTRHRPYVVTVVGTIMVLAIQPIAVAAGNTPFMHRIAASLIRNP